MVHNLRLGPAIYRRDQRFYITREWEHSPA
jgi:hypothetical protein